MTNASTSLRIRTLVAKVCALDVARVREDQTLRSYGLDSMRALELVVMIEDAFYIRLEGDALDSLHASTVGELASYVDGLRADAAE